VVANNHQEHDLEAEKTFVMNVVEVMVAQMGSAHGFQIHNALLICVSCVHLCCESVWGSRGMGGLGEVNRK
jgi:hypothetical protein